MGLKLGTQEAANAFFKSQDEDPEFQQIFKGLTIKLLFLGTDCPGNEDRQLALDIENGRFLEILVTRKPATSDLRTAPFDHTKYSFRVQASQQTLMDMIQALPHVKIDGDFGQLMAQAAGFINFIKYLAKMDIEP